MAFTVEMIGSEMSKIKIVAVNAMKINGNANK